MERADRKARVGVVVSDSRDKTITVEVRNQKRHVRYGKMVPVRKKYHVHDETNEASVGDTVRIVETRPLSKSKRWRVVEIMVRAR